MNRIILLLVMICLVSLPGCSKEPEPQRVVRSFYRLTEIARQEGFAVVQEDLMNLLSSGSRKRFEECAATLNRAMPAGVEFRAKDCLIFQSYHGTRGDFAVDEVAPGDERVRLKVTSNGTDRLVELVKEDGWKIDLDSTIALNQSGVD